MELKQQIDWKNTKKQAAQPVHYDIADIGYQQFDLIDFFDLFQNPHGEEDLTEEERMRIKNLYSVSFKL